MARQCVKLVLGDKVAKLRLTLRSQKILREKYPESEVLETILGAAEEPETMEFLLTLALGFEGNDNEIRDGAELYDLLVDHGYCGQADFMGLLMDIAKNAGLVSQEDRNRLQRVVTMQIRRAMEQLENAADGGMVMPATLDEEAQEGEEGPENPTPKTL